jgi:phosphoglucosamine mutase
MLEAALCAGISSIGLDAWKLGIVTTPGVAFLTRQVGAAAGVMISASHNPVEDNGIKFFSSAGFKLADALEDEIAAHVAAPSELPRPTGAAVGEILERQRVVRAYVAHLIALAPARMRGMTIVVDAAYGAAYDIAPKLFERLGATVVRLHCRPNGAKINVRCGSTNLDSLRAAVRAHPGSVGVAFDGDADRAQFVDEGGNDVTGDHVLAILAREFSDRGELPSKTVVATVMSNLGLELALRECGIKLERTAVGDRYVLEAMQRGKHRLGGEQSGHIIDLESSATGDGLATTVRVLSIARERGGLAKLAAMMRTYPQVLVNVRVADRSRVDDPHVQASIADIANKLRGKGRVFVRASGTEPVIRIMLEGQDEAELRAYANHIAEKVARADGAADSITRYP